jgi:hypothetical protein
MGQPVPDSLTVSGHSWSNLVMAGYPLAYAKDDTALGLPSALNATKSRPPPSVPLPDLGIVAPSVSDLPARALERERHCRGYTLHNH